MIINMPRKILHKDVDKNNIYAHLSCKTHLMRMSA